MPAILVAKSEMSAALFPAVSFTALAVTIIAAWRVTHLFWGEEGPNDVFVWLRRKAGRGSFGRLLDCFYCLSLWVAAPLAWLLGTTWLERLLLWFAISGGAILLQRVTERTPAAPPAAQWRHEPAKPATEEQTDVMLR